MRTEFFNLSEEKRRSIVNAAVTEFAEKGFGGASTNAIVQAAGISKGLLFHYFKNKKILYFSLYDYCLSLVVDEFYGYFDNSETEFFQKLRSTIHIKMKLREKYPDLFGFLQTAYLEDNPEIRRVLNSQNSQMLNESYVKIFSNIDMARFREGIEFSKVLKVVSWTFERYAEETLRHCKITGQPFEYAKAVTEVDGYIEFFKKAFYKT